MTIINLSVTITFASTFCVTREPPKHKLCVDLQPFGGFSLNQNRILGLVRVPQALWFCLPAWNELLRRNSWWCRFPQSSKGQDLARYLLFLSHGSVDALKTGYYRALSITFKAAQRQSGFKIFMKVVFFMFILLFSFSPFNLIWKEQGGNDSSFLCLQNRDTWYLQPWVKSCLDRDIGYFFMVAENKFFPLLLMKLLSLCVFFSMQCTLVCFIMLTAQVIFIPK